MPPLDFRDAVTVITGIVTITSVVVSVRLTQTEVLRELKAIHSRLDRHAERLNGTEQRQAVLTAVVEERTGTLRASQRFKLGTEAPMFKDETDAD